MRSACRLSTFPENLGKRGLTGTFQLMTDAIQSKMGPAGTVLIQSLEKSASSTTAYQKVLANLPPAQQTYVASLADMVGGSKSMQAILELTGGSAVTFNSNVKTIAGTTAEAGGNVKGWADVQKDFNQKMAEASQTVASLAITLGQKLIPIVEKALEWISKMVDWMSKHKEMTKILAIAIGTTLVAAFLASTIAAMSFWTAVTIGLAPAIVALVAGIIYLATHWSQVWADIKRWTDDAIGFLRTKFGTLLVLLAGPLAPIALLALHWQQVWTGIKTVTGTVVSSLLTWFRQMGDGFFAVIEGILSAASHLPFVGHYFAAANTAVKGAKSDFDSTLSQWSTDAGSWGSSVGNNLTAGLDQTIRKNMPASVANAALYTSQVVAAMHKGARTASPSKATIEIGQQLAAGLRIGLEQQAAATAVTASTFMTNTINVMQPDTGLTLAGPATGGGGSAGGTAGGDLLIYLFPGSAEFGRAAGPAVRQWMNTTPGRNAVKITTRG